MTKQEEILHLLEQTEIPVEISEKLAAMSNKEVYDESLKVGQHLKAADVSSEDKAYAIAVILEQKRRVDRLTAENEALEQERKALEQDIAVKQAQNAELKEFLSILEKVKADGAAEAGNPSSGKIGRNDPCPCGSGKKYKHCCGK